MIEAGRHIIQEPGFGAAPSGFASHLIATATLAIPIFPKTTPVWMSNIGRVIQER